MRGEESKLKMHIAFGGVTSIKGSKFSYKAGEIAEDMLIDPDFLTFSIFEDFSSNAEIAACESNVVKVWYRLSNEDISIARCIYIDKDNEIRKMWSEAKEFGEVYIYVEHSVPDLVAGENLVNEYCLNVEPAEEIAGAPFCFSTRVESSPRIIIHPRLLHLQRFPQ